jgi:hypothetical protein
MEEALTPAFIAENLEELILDFEYVDTTDIDDLSDFLLSIWVLLGVDDQTEIDSDDNLVEGSSLFILNDQIFDTLIKNNKEAFMDIIKTQLLIAEKYEVLALMIKVF